MTEWATVHPWVLFILALAAINAVESVAAAWGRRRCLTCRENLVRSRSGQPSTKRFRAAISAAKAVLGS